MSFVGGEISTHGAMLSVLAEIATQTLQADSKEYSFIKRHRPLTKKKVFGAELV